MSSALQHQRFSSMSSALDCAMSPPPPHAAQVVASYQRLIGGFSFNGIQSIQLGWVVGNMEGRQITMDGMRSGRRTHYKSLGCSQRRSLACGGGELARNRGLADSPATAAWQIRAFGCDGARLASNSSGMTDSPVKRISPSQRGFRPVSQTLETPLTRVVEIKLFPSLSCSFHAKSSHLLMWHLI
jgi:hypothetical protein